MTRMALTAVVLALAGAVAASTASCFVHRRSGDLPTCTLDIECDLIAGEVCDRGYCVAPSGECPRPCTSCDLGDRSCRIECPTNHPCGDLQCPAGYDCTFKCNNGSCGAIDCAQARSCDIDCSGAAACGNINCGGAECDISCSGPVACPSIDCALSCRCDVTCNSTGAACPSMSCPRTAFGDLCTRTGSAGANCDSDAPGCDRCFDF